jgi:hypothetical protein
MKKIERIIEYFTGKYTIKYYNRLLKEHPKRADEYREERNNYVLFGKILPNISGLTAIVLGVASDPFWFILIGGGEGMRNSLYSELETNKKEHKNKEITK